VDPVSVFLRLEVGRRPPPLLIPMPYDVNFTINFACFLLQVVEKFSNFPLERSRPRLAVLNVLCGANCKPDAQAVRLS
jgi:hypothetical protein